MVYTYIYFYETKLFLNFRVNIKRNFTFVIEKKIYTFYNEIHEDLYHNWKKIMATEPLAGLICIYMYMYIEYMLNLRKSFR